MAPPTLSALGAAATICEAPADCARVWAVARRHGFGAAPKPGEDVLSVDVHGLNAGLALGAVAHEMEPDFAPEALVALTGAGVLKGKLRARLAAAGLAVDDASRNAGVLVIPRREVRRYAAEVQALATSEADEDLEIDRAEREGVEGEDPKVT